MLVVRQAFTKKDGNRSVLQLVSINMGLDWTLVTTIYYRRWTIEEFHKSLKQPTSLGKSPTKTVTTQVNHFLAVTLTYSKPGGLKIRHALGHFRIKAQRYLVGFKTMNQKLVRLAT